MQPAAEERRQEERGVCRGGAACAIIATIVGLLSLIYSSYNELSEVSRPSSHEQSDLRERRAVGRAPVPAHAIAPIAPLRHGYGWKPADARMPA